MKFSTISKTTINGVLALLIAALTSLLAFQVPSALMTPQQSHVWMWVTFVANLICAICRAIVGVLQNDSPPPAK